MASLICKLIEDTPKTVPGFPIGKWLGCPCAVLRSVYLSSMTINDECRSDRQKGTVWGAMIADAVAMPVHWYYDRLALRRDYGLVTGYLPPKSPHADSILWRSEYRALNKNGEILHDQAKYWGRRGIHYHQNLRAGENTLNFRLGMELFASLTTRGRYDRDDFLTRYLDFMLTPGRHADTYVEECHRNFFANHARGRRPAKCGAPDIHIGGLTHVPILAAFLADEPDEARAAVNEHVALTHPSQELLRVADVFTCILLSILDGEPLRSAIESNASDYFSKMTAEKWLHLADHDVIGRILSPACYIRDAFPASLYLAWKYEGDFRAGVLANANLGGDNCHRGAVVGALLGAADGFSALPDEFVQGLNNNDQLGRLAEAAGGREQSAVT